MRRKRPIGVTRLEKRKMPFHPDEVRSKIQAIKLVEHLHDHIFDRVDRNGRKLADLNISQVRAIDILLKKVLPDLTRTLITADLNVRYVAELPKVLTKEEWVKKYGNPDLELTALPAPNGGGNGHTN